MYTPRDILNVIYEEKLESAFMTSLAYHIRNYSIGELTDKVIRKTDSGYCLLSQSYQINVPILDPDVINARENDQYVSAFLSRHESAYQVHFLVHPYRRTEKSAHEEEILHEVMEYMLLRTIIALRLDTPEKVREYAAQR